MDERYRNRRYYDRDDESWPHREERDFRRRYSGYEWQRFPVSFDAYEPRTRYHSEEREPSRYQRRDLHDEGMYEGPRHSEHEHESFGHKLVDAGQRAMRKVKRAFRGPKGYRRSDERIREDVNDQLAQQDRMDPSEIEVSVANGEVTLIGSVVSRYEKFCAEEIADDVAGVTEVHNKLRVRRELVAQPTASESATLPSAQTPGEPRNGMRP